MTARRNLYYKAKLVHGYPGKWTVKTQVFIDYINDHPIKIKNDNIVTMKYYVVTDYINKKQTVVVNSDEIKEIEAKNRVGIMSNKVIIKEYNDLKTATEAANKYVSGRSFKLGQMMNKSVAALPTIRFYKKEIFSITSRKALANAIIEFKNNADNKGAMLDQFMIILTYRSENEHPVYRTYDINTPLAYGELINRIRNDDDIIYNVNGEMKSYENMYGALDYSEIKILYKSNKMIGVMIPETREVLTLKNYNIQIYSPDYDDKTVYNCLLNILVNCLQCNKNRKAIIKDSIILFMTTIIDEEQNTFKISLQDIDREKLLNVEIVAGIKFNIYYIDSNNSLEVYYESDYNSFFNRNIDLLLKDDHIYLIESMEEPYLGIPEIITVNDYKRDAVEICTQVIYDFETCYNTSLRRQVPYLVNCAEYTEDGKFIRRINFIGETCAFDMIKYYNCNGEENLDFDADHHIINFAGFNSAKFDVFFIISAMMAMEMDPKVIIYKDKLFVEDGYLFFNDLLPLIPVGSLSASCKNFGCSELKMTGAISFDYLNKLFSECDNNVELFLNQLKNIPTEKEGNLYNLVIKYCEQDVAATANLYFKYQEHVNQLTRNIIFKDEYGQGLGYLDDIKLSKFKTLGQLSMTILLSTIKESPKLEFKNKSEYYKYQTIITSNLADKKLANEEVTRLYKDLRDALIASISYGLYDTMTSEIHSLIDVVSLYPYVLGSDFLYGHGRLKYIEYSAKILHDNLDHTIIPLGIYFCTVTFDEEKFQRIPFKNGTDSYQWIHKETITRFLYAQDIVNLGNSGAKIILHYGYQFSKVATGREIFGKYMSVFTEEKNKQDLYKLNKDPLYNPGLRETCKAFMNILSGKLVQVYGYESNLVFDKNNKKDFKGIKSDSEVVMDDNFTIYKKEKDLCQGSEIYDFGITFGQLYTYSREHMQKMIEKVYKYGYVPKVIETDSIIVEREFVTKCKLDYPLEFCYNNTQENQLKRFGEFDIEIDNITELCVYRKKSYCLRYKEGTEEKIKSRFKGVFDQSLYAKNDILAYLEIYNEMKTYYESLKPLEQARYTDMIKEANYRISSYLGYETQNKNNLISSDPFELFRKLITKEEVTVINTIIKKNYSSNKNKQLSLENIIVHKTFNKRIVMSPKKSHKKQVRISKLQKFNNNYLQMLKCPVYDLQMS